MLDYHTELLGGNDTDTDYTSIDPVSTNALQTATPTFFVDQTESPKVWLDLMDFRFKVMHLKSQNSLFQNLLSAMPGEKLQILAPHLVTIIQHAEP